MKELHINLPGGNLIINENGIQIFLVGINEHMVIINGLKMDKHAFYPMQVGNESGCAACVWKHSCDGILELKCLDIIRALLNTYYGHKRKDIEDYYIEWH